MGMQRINVEADSPASPEAVIAIVSDGSRWPSCTPLGSFRLETHGPEGPGAIRVFRTAMLATREQIVESEAPHHFAYVLVSGLPLRDYRADIELEALTEGGTRLRWRAEFTAKVPGTGWLFRAFLTRFVRRCATGLAAAS